MVTDLERHIALKRGENAVKHFCKSLWNAMFCHNKYWLEMMTLLKQSLATKIGCVPLFYREITSNAFLLCSADKKTQERGRGIKLEKMCLLCGLQKEHQNLKNRSFFKEIEYLSESVAFRNPSSNFPHIDIGCTQRISSLSLSMKYSESIRSF